MRKLLLALLLTITGFAAAQSPVLPASPRQLYPGLFEAVQLGNVYPDNKTFVHAVAKEAPADVLRAYTQQKDAPGFDLKAFVAAHFTPPAAAGGQYQSQVTAGLRHHLDTLWTVLQRHPDTLKRAGSSLLPLPRPYIVPGGRFREVYYWDSYFTMLGLAESHRTSVIRDMVDNFAYLLDTYGFIPNGNRSYYLTRSQPPFFALMVSLLAKQEGDGKTLTRYQPQLLREYAYWMAGAETLKPGRAQRRAVRMPQGELLNRYWDDSDQPREESYAQDVAAAKLSKQPPAQFYRNVRAAAASGWDFSTRWFGADAQLGSIQTTDLVPVDLNCLLYNLENTIAKSYQQQGNPAQANAFLAKAQNRKRAILAYCWDAKAGWFVDYNLPRQQRSTLQTLARGIPAGIRHCHAAPGGAGSHRTATQLPKGRGTGHHPQPQRSAMGRPERLGAVAIHGHRRAGALQPVRPGPHHWHPLDSPQRRGFSANRQAHGEIQRGGPPPQSRGW
jgi:alpha,alpha-trehalase